MRTTYKVLGLAASMVLAGCYHYVPAVATASPQGTPVRAQLDTLSSFELAEFTVNNIDQVEGEMVRVDARELILSATWLQAITGTGYAGNGWTVTIPESNVTAFEQRRLSWWRTAIIVGGIAAGTYFGFDALGLTGSGGNGGGGTPAPQ